MRIAGAQEVISLGGRQSSESAPEFLDIRRNPLLMHIRPNSGWSQTWSPRFAAFYWRCGTDRRKLRSLGSLNVPNVTKPTISNAELFIHIRYPSPCELVARDIETKDDAQENAELVKARLKVLVDASLSNAFNHRIHNQHLRTEEGIGRMFRWWAKAEFALKPQFTAPGQSVISQ